MVSKAKLFSVVAPQYIATLQGITYRCQHEIVHIALSMNQFHTADPRGFSRVCFELLSVAWIAPNYPTPAAVVPPFFRQQPDAQAQLLIRDCRRGS